jgi:hypothetical protein
MLARSLAQQQQRDDGIIAGLKCFLEDVTEDVRSRSHLFGWQGLSVHLNFLHENLRVRV